MRPKLAFEAVEILVDKRACHFARTVSAEIEEQYGVAVLYSADWLSVLFNPSRDDKFVALHIVGGGIFVIVFKCRLGVRYGRFGFCSHETVVRLFDSVPAFVSVHRPEAADYGGDLSDAAFFHFAFDFPDKREPAGGGRVAAVRKGVEEYFVVFFVGADFQDGIKVVEHRVHSGVGTKPEQMEGAALVERLEYFF